MKDCPFCNLEERILLENNLAVAILSNPKKTSGHFLVVPKRHVETLFDLNDNELIDAFSLIRKVEQVLLNDSAKGCDVRQNYRPFIMQSRIKVDHLHFHVLPRNNEDEIYQRVEKYETDLFSDLEDKEVAKYINIIKQLDREHDE